MAIVEWLDPQEQSDVPLAAPPSLFKWTSVGWVVQKDKDFLVLAHSIGESGTGERLVIARSLVKKVTKLS